MIVHEDNNADACCVGGHSLDIDNIGKADLWATIVFEARTITQCEFTCLVEYHLRKKGLAPVRVTYIHPGCGRGLTGGNLECPRAVW
mmetsp:Transcript_124103/g.322387  ORF Transcript_124103/g.322387 Transcript_124103/m.322387 type:complete len:87 (-) Transcript_124103:1116-1376(-)